MHDLAVARANLDRLHPLRLGEIRRDVEMLMLDRAVGRQLVGVGISRTTSGLPALQPSGNVGSAAGPPDRPWAHRRSPTRSAWRGRRRSAAARCGRSRRRVGVPRRHVPVADFVADGLRPGPGLLIGEQRHRAISPGRWQPARVLEDDGRDVLAERRHVLFGGRREYWPCSDGNPSPRSREGLPRRDWLSCACASHEASRRYELLSVPLGDAHCNPEVSIQGRICTVNGADTTLPPRCTWIHS